MKNKIKNIKISESTFSRGGGSVLTELYNLYNLIKRRGREIYVRVDREDRG